MDFTSGYIISTYSQRGVDKKRRQDVYLHCFKRDVYGVSKQVVKRRLI